MKKITISISDTLFHESKLYAQKYRLTMNELVCKLLRENIDSNNHLLTDLFTEMDKVQIQKPADWERGALYEL